MNQSAETAKLFAALVQAQAEFSTLPKNKSGYGYKYTDFDTVVSAVRPILTRHNLGFMQTLGTTAAGESCITTRLFSSAGEYVEDTVTLPAVAMAKTNAAQNMGAAITYMKRYALCAILGISSDEDTDAADSSARPPVKTEKKAEPPQNTPRTPAFTPAGGESTPEETKTMQTLLRSTYPNGKRIFSNDEVRVYSNLRKEKTAQEVIAEIQSALSERIARIESRA